VEKAARCGRMPAVFFAGPPVIITEHTRRVERVVLKSKMLDETGREFFDGYPYRAGKLGEVRRPLSKATHCAQNHAASEHAGRVGYVAPAPTSPKKRL
jgi:hypothetical protein